jgi:hypothetical protein
MIVREVMCAAPSCMYATAGLWALLLLTSPDPWVAGRLLAPRRWMAARALDAQPVHAAGDEPGEVHAMSWYGNAVRICFYVYLSLQVSPAAALTLQRRVTLETSQSITFPTASRMHDSMSARVSRPWRSISYRLGLAIHCQMAPRLEGLPRLEAVDTEDPLVQRTRHQLETCARPTSVLRVHWGALAVPFFFPRVAAPFSRTYAPNHLVQSLLSTSTLWAVCADTFTAATSTKMYGFLGAGELLRPHPHPPPVLLRQPPVVRLFSPGFALVASAYAQHPLRRLAARRGDAGSAAGLGGGIGFRSGVQGYGSHR